MINATNWTAIIQPSQIFQVANDNTGGLFWLGSVFLIWLVMMMAMMGFGFASAVLTASFICFMLSLVLAYMGLINFLWCLVFLGAILFTLWYGMYNSQ